MLIFMLACTELFVMLKTRIFVIFTELSELFYTQVRNGGRTFYINTCNIQLNFTENMIRMSYGNLLSWSKIRDEWLNASHIFKLVDTICSVKNHKIQWVTIKTIFDHQLPWLMIDHQMSWLTIKCQGQPLTTMVEHQWLGSTVIGYGCHHSLPWLTRNRTIPGSL